MAAYIIRRLLLLIPTLLGIILINFVIVQFAPGGPVEQIIAKYSTTFSGDSMSRLSGKSSSGGDAARTLGAERSNRTYRGSENLDPAFIKRLEKQFGFDKPAYVRFFQMLWNYLKFDFGKSYFRNETVLNLIAEKLPVSISLGLWSTIIIYLISIPLGIRKAVKDGSHLDIWTSAVVNILSSVPQFMMALFLIILFAGGSYFNIFPIRGLVSNNWSELGTMAKILDYLWHIILPVFCMVLTGLAYLTLFTKNSFLDEMHKVYVMTARSKGLNERRVLYGHVFRNAMLIIIAGFPAVFVSALFTNSILIEVIFTLDGIGLLGIQSLLTRDYPVVFATVYIFALIGLVMRLVGDILYTVIDPRIDFEVRN